MSVGLVGLAVVVQVTYIIIRWCFRHFVKIKHAVKQKQLSDFHFTGFESFVQLPSALHETASGVFRLEMHCKISNLQASVLFFLPSSSSSVLLYLDGDAYLVFKLRIAGQTGLLRSSVPLVAG